MALNETTLKLTDDATTLVYNALGLVPVEDFEAAKAEVITKLTALEATGTKPTAMDTVVAFANTLDDVAHETKSVGFQKVADAIDTVVIDVADGTFNLFKELKAAVKLSHGAKEISAEVK